MWESEGSLWILTNAELSNSGRAPCSGLQRSRVTSWPVPRKADITSCVHTQIMPSNSNLLMKSETCHILICYLLICSLDPHCHRKRCVTYMLRESFEGGLIDPQDDVAHIDAAALGSWLARKKLFNAHHAGARGLVEDVLLSTKTEAQAGRVLQQAHLKHIICRQSNRN